MLYYMLVSVRILILLIGLIIAYKSFKIYRLNNEEIQYFLLSIGFTFLSIAVLVEGILFEFLGITLLIAHLIEASIVMLGLVIVIISVLLS